mgnify:CR=1 FL=1
MRRFRMITLYAANPPHKAAPGPQKTPLISVTCAHQGLRPGAGFARLAVEGVDIWLAHDDAGVRRGLSGHVSVTGRSHSCAGVATPPAPLGGETGNR